MTLSPMIDHWINKFRCALRGVGIGIAEHSSFKVHLVATLAVFGLAYWLDCIAWQWSLLSLCVGLVWSLELLNSAIEHLARGVCPHHNPEVGKALDTASAAVLLGAMTSVAIGCSILGYQFYLKVWPD